MLSIHRRTVTGDSPAGPSLARYSILTAPIALALLLVLIGGYVLHWSWTGYLVVENHHPTPRPLWDWLTLALQPLMLAFVPVLLKLRHGRHEGWQAVGAVALVVFGVLVLGGYLLRWHWTGFADNTLWDWLGLFLMPFLLPLVFVFLADWERDRTDRLPASTRTRHPTPRPASPLLTGAAGAVIAAALMAAAFSAGTLKRADGAISTPRPDTLSSGASAWTSPVTVDSRDPNWTDTHVRVTKGEHVEIAAFGLVRPSHRPGYRFVGPDGSTEPHRGQQSLVPAVNHEALLATVGARGQSMPIATHLATGRVVDVGHYSVLDVTTDGELFLGMNDTRTADNTGWFGATIRVVD